MKAQRLPSGAIIAPVRLEAEDGTIGDGMVELKPGDPGYDDWDMWLKERGE